MYNKVYLDEVKENLYGSARQGDDSGSQVVPVASQNESICDRHNICLLLRPSVSQSELCCTFMIVIKEECVLCNVKGSELKLKTSPQWMLLFTCIHMIFLIEV